MNALKAATDATFDTLTTSGPAVVEFSSPTCAPCKQIEPVLEKMAVEFTGQVRFLKINVNESPKSCARFRIRSVPTLLFMKGGTVSAQLVGAVAAPLIRERVMELLGRSANR